jgi:putative Mn2+ efflux pump MntP
MRGLKELLAAATRYGGAAGAFSVLLIACGAGIVRVVPPSDEVAAAIRWLGFLLILCGGVRLVMLTFSAAGPKHPRKRS